MMQLRTVFFIFGILVCFTAQAQAAKPFVCITSGPVAFNELGPEPAIELAAFDCRALEATSTGLEAISLTLLGGSIYAACTGVGAPMSLLLDGASLGFQTIKLVIGNLPCRDLRREKEIEMTARAVLCDELAKQGIGCRL